jgi:hypothetical protein
LLNNTFHALAILQGVFKEIKMKYGELTETYMNSNVRDNKGREIGFIVGFRDNGTDFRAYVQNARAHYCS